jgi:heme oxygenase
VRVTFQRLNEEADADRSDPRGSSRALLAISSIDEYRRYLIGQYGFVCPLERSLLDTAGLDRFIDPRRMQKHSLLEHDLRSLGLRSLEIESIPQCMWIPWFVDVHEALGWAYLLERNTLTHANGFRHLAEVLPGEAAFAASYLKCYAGAVGQMWRSFEKGLEASVRTPEHSDRVLLACRAAYRRPRRWRHLVNGTAMTGPQMKLSEHPIAEPAPSQGPAEDEVVATGADG